MPQDTIQARFGLRRPNFILDPLSEEDADFFAPRSHVRVADIIENLQIDLATGLPPKRLFWGPYGGGKTHTLQNTMRKLHSIMSGAIQPIYVECPDLSKRSTFLDLYREGIMRSLGQDFILSILERTRDKIGYGKREELLRKLKDLLTDEELAKAVTVLIDPTDEKKLLLWSWISGVPVPRADLADLQQTQDLTTAEPARLAEFLKIIGKLVKELEDKVLVLILDEIDRVRSVGPETIGQFQTAFTRLVDPNQRHLSVLIGCSSQSPDDLPEIFAERGPVYSRLGRDKLLEIPALDDPDVQPFIREIVQYVKDPTADRIGLIRNAKAQVAESLDEPYFPFSGEAVGALKAALGNDMTPREITLKMTHAAGKAFNHNQSCVVSSMIS